MYRFDRETGQAPQISVWPEWVFGTPAKDIKYRFYYSDPVLLSPHDPGVLYTAAQYVFRSTDEGHSWDTISPDLTRNRQDVMGEISGGPISSNASSLFHVSLIRTIAESPLQEGELWVGTDDSTVQVSQDGGGSWRDVSPPDLPEWTTITAIDVSPHRRGTVYISGERHRVSDRTPYLYKTTDYGSTWQRITNGIREDDLLVGHPGGSGPAGSPLRGNGDRRVRLLRRRGILAVPAAQPATGDGHAHGGEGRRRGGGHPWAGLLDHGQRLVPAPDHAGRGLGSSASVRSRPRSPSASGREGDQVSGRREEPAEGGDDRILPGPGACR